MSVSQEVIVELNKRIKEDKVKPITNKYIIKIRMLESNLKTKQAKIEELLGKIKQIDNEIVYTDGAISILMELAAEEEGILLKPAELSDKINDPPK